MPQNKMNALKIWSLLLFLFLSENCWAFFIVKVPEILPKVNATTIPTKEPSQTRTTFDWGKYTSTGAPGASRTTYDWGQHTGTGAAGASRTTYDWGQHTGTQAPGASRTTYDWGQHTGTGASRTTYDWGQHTGTGASRTTYDWGQHTGTGASRTTYDWGQHTGTGASRTTYDWGQHTGTNPTYEPDNNSTQNPNEGNEYRCPAGKYTCKGTIGLCISLNQICDGKQDCPHRDDEDKKRCFPGFGGSNIKKKNYNNFAGTGFMFSIKNLVVKNADMVKLFNQNSDNRRA
jgi:hypothetical protein